VGRIVIASEAKQSILSLRGGMDCFASLAMTERYSFAISPHISREFCYRTSRPPIRGRRECRAPDAPDSRVCRIVVASTRVGQVTPEIARHSPRNGFTAYSALSPATGFFATVACGCFRKLDASIGASGPHDFAVRVTAPSSSAR
jgi:hypothetical protein